MSSLSLLIILFLYLGFLFAIAQWAEKKSNTKWTNNAYVYTFSLAVYCTAWTYYGSVGVAANSGLNYLAIYIGPVIIIPAWILILKKIIRISRVNKISGIADFISLRYGNDRFLGALVAFICIAGIIPYIALQLKAISETFHIVTNTQDTNILKDTTTYVAIALALFTSYYGTRYVDASEKRKGIVTAIAVESFLKLLFFITIGVFVTFFAFDGFQDIFDKASLLDGFSEKNTIGGLPQAINWFLLCVLSLFAIFLLPRQFHVSIIENNREKHIKTAIWLFPLYLLLFNIFVYPIAWGGNVLFDGNPVNADMYSLHIAQLFDQQWLVLLVFLGGFSAAISMIVVSTIALSTMLSNNLLIPYGLIGKLQSDKQEKNSNRIVRIRKVGIFLLIVIAYLLYRYLALDYSLVSIGLISFVVIAQLAPSFFGALFWKRGSAKGAISGIVVGFLICLYTLLAPYAIGISAFDNRFIAEGLFGIELFKPLQLFGLDYLEPVPHALFWSLGFNFFTYYAVSISFKGNYRERNYAEMYVDVDKYISNHENAFVWKGTANRADIEKVLKRFLGEERTTRALKIFNLKYKIDADTTMADARLIKFSENLLTGHIGTASAKILIASVAKEDQISLTEVLRILEESKENILLNKKLTETSNELQQLSIQLKEANQTLLKKDKQKDDFLDTVTHELRTPITAIRASTELLYDDDEMPVDIKKQFLQNIITESDRLNRLIDQILDLEKFETGTQKLELTENAITKTFEKALNPLKQLVRKNNIDLKTTIAIKEDLLVYDDERIIQVFTNLLSNAIKFSMGDKPTIEVNFFEEDDFIKIEVNNAGDPIPQEDLLAIFNKFYQSNNQNLKKPIGSGLGLAISKRIIEAHLGIIWAENTTTGVSIKFTLPKHNA